MYPIDAKTAAIFCQRIRICGVIVENIDIISARDPCDAQEEPGICLQIHEKKTIAGNDMRQVLILGAGAEVEVRRRGIGDFLRAAGDNRNTRSKEGSHDIVDFLCDEAAAADGSVRKRYGFVLLIR